MTLALPWHTLKEREKLVWAAIYSLNRSNPEEAIREANQAVQALQNQNADGADISEPEHDAASSGVEIKWEQFVAWYPVALAIKRRGRVTDFGDDEAACRTAFEAYRMSKNDYY